MSITRKAIPVALMVAVASVSSPIWAQPTDFPALGMGQGQGMGRNMPAFSDFDMDGNGAINVDEFNAHQARHRQQRAQ